MISLAIFVNYCLIETMFRSHRSEKYFEVIATNRNEQIEQKQIYSARSALNLLNLPNHLFINRFPKFWSVLEEELDIYDKDLNQIKLIFTALRFMTSTSIASIKTPKKLSGLESEYMKLRSNTKTFEELCSKLPALKGIDSFTSGIMVACILLYFYNMQILYGRYP